MQEPKQASESFATIPQGSIRHINDALANIEANLTITSGQKRALANLLYQSLEEQTDTLTITQIQEYRSRHGEQVTVRTIRNHLKMISDAGLATEITHERDRGGRPVIQYVLKPLHKELVTTIDKELNERISESRRLAKRNRALLTKLRTSDAQFLSTYCSAKPVSETVFTGIFDRVMRFSVKDKVPDNRIAIQIRLSGVRVYLMATTETGPSSQLAVLGDQRCIRAVLTETAAIIEQKLNNPFGSSETSSRVRSHRKKLHDLIHSNAHQGTLFDEDGRQIADPEKDNLWREINAEAIQNRFFIDVSNIAKRMGYRQPSSAKTRSLVNKMLRRLNETKFTIRIGGEDDASDKILDIMEKLGLANPSGEYRFITELHSQYEEKFGNEERLHESMTDEEAVDPWREDLLEKTRVWQISISDHLYQALKDPTVRAYYHAHEEIMKETSGVGHSIYNWFNSILGRTNLSLYKQKEKTYHKPLNHLHQAIWPTRHFFQFEDRFVTLIRKHSAPGTFDETLTMNRVAMFGFLFTLYYDDVTSQLMLKVSRDPKDKLTGNLSAHNRALAAAMGE